MAKSAVPDLPLFVYGSLRPGELAYRQVADLISAAVPAVAEGLRLSVRDGLPFAHQEEGAAVHGDVLRADQDRVGEFYRRVRAYEGTDLYAETDWSVLDADGREIQARVLLACGLARAVLNCSMSSGHRRATRCSARD